MTEQGAGAWEEAGSGESTWAAKWVGTYPPASWGGASAWAGIEILGYRQSWASPA